MAMSNDAKVPRILHFRFTVALADPDQVVAQLKALAPWYELFGGMRIKVLQNVDDPTRFVQIMEYEAPEAVELSRQQIASDPNLQAYLQAWRAMVAGTVDIDIYKDVTT
jgi:hypothetical protein